eukprot:6819491-Pyramimonas_sp.AAC.1
MPRCGYRSRWSSEPCEGCAKVSAGTHSDPATGDFGGAPYGATILVRGVPKWAGDACGPCRWGLRWSSVWGHDPRE